MRTLKRSHAMAYRLVKALNGNSLQDVFIIDFSECELFRYQSFLILRWRHSQRLTVSLERCMSFGGDIVGCVGLEDIFYHFKVISPQHSILGYGHIRHRSRFETWARIECESGRALHDEVKQPHDGTFVEFVSIARLLRSG